MASIEGVGGAQPHGSMQPQNALSDRDAMKLLGDLKESVHRVGVTMANFEPHITPAQTFTGALTVGVVFAALMPPAAPGIIMTAVIFGAAAAAAEAAFAAGINGAGAALARLTEPPPPRQ